LPETSDEKEKRLLRELEGKNIEYYSIMLSAWINTKMERDKTLVTLAAAAIGLLITILTTVGTNNIIEMILFAISICLFLTTIWSSLTIYQLNSKHIEDSLRGSSQSNSKLEKYDKLSIGTFISGALIALMIGILSAYNNLEKKEDQNMSTKNNVTPMSICNDSLEGLNKLHPEMLSKSFNGSEKLSPDNLQPTTQPQEQNSTASQNNSNSVKED
jgi:hypothetical protein